MKWPSCPYAHLQYQYEMGPGCLDTGSVPFSQKIISNHQFGTSNTDVHLYNSTQDCGTSGAAGNKPTSMMLCPILK